MARYVINSIEWHESALGELRNAEWDASLEVEWHVTAMAYVRYGEVHGLNGPGIETRAYGIVRPMAIEPELFLKPNATSKPHFSVKIRKITYAES